MCAIMVVWQLMFPRDSLSSMVSLLSLNNTSRNPSLAKKKGAEKPLRNPETIHYPTQQLGTKRNKKDLWFHINEAGFEPHATCDLLAEMERSGREILSLKRRANLDKLHPKLLLTTMTTDESLLARHANNLQWITPDVFFSIKHHDLIQFNLWFKCFSLINSWFLKIITSLTLCPDCRLHLQILLQKVWNVLLEVCKFVYRHKILNNNSTDTQLGGTLLETHFVINLSENQSC